MNIAEKLTTIAENEQIVAEKNAELEEALYSKSEGGKSYYDAFWDAFQDNGNRTRYSSAFYSPQLANYWGNTTLKPKYPIKATEANSMFSCSGFRGDITQAVDLDVSQSTIVTNLFSYCYYISKVGVIDVRQVNTGHISMFQDCRALETIEEIVLKEDGTQFNNSSSWTFNNCNSLKNIKITGVISFNVNLQYSPLTKESITSVINALSSTTNGLTVTLNKAAKEAAFTAEEWEALISTKSNWTISLV